MVCHRAGAGRDHDARGLSACASPGLGRRRGGQVAACNRVDGYGGQHAPRVSTVGDFGANSPVACELFGYAGRFLQRAPPPRCPVFDGACDRPVRVGRDKRAHVPAAIEKPAQRETGGHDRSFDGRNLVTGSRKLPRIWAMLAGERGVLGQLLTIDEARGSQEDTLLVQGRVQVLEDAGERILAGADALNRRIPGKHHSSVQACSASGSG